MSTVEKYLKPEVIRQISRLDLRAQFIVKGFLHGLHASPFHGFSVEFSEHRKYTPGDDPHDIDWLVYAKTDKYYVKKFEAETNITGYLVMDLSQSMAYTYRQELTKFDYAICLAAALCYLMIHQNDPVGLVTFAEADQQLPAAQVEAAADRQRPLDARQAAAHRPDRRRPQPRPARRDAQAFEPGDDLQRPAGRTRPDHRGAPSAAARRPRRDPVPHPRRSRSRLSRSPDWSNSKNPNRTTASKSTPTASAATTSPSSKPSANTTAASASRAASTTSPSTPACRSTGR